MSISVPFEDFWDNYPCDVRVMRWLLILLQEIFDDPVRNFEACATRWSENVQLWLTRNFSSNNYHAAVGRLPRIWEQCVVEAGYLDPVIDDLDIEASRARRTTGTGTSRRKFVTIDTNVDQQQIDRLESMFQRLDAPVRPSRRSRSTTREEEPSRHVTRRTSSRLPEAPRFQPRARQITTRSTTTTTTGTRPSRSNNPTELDNDLMTIEENIKDF